MRKSHPIIFSKYQALGNDYLVFRPEDLPEPLTGERIQWICDRHYGVGSDGILVGPEAEKPVFHVRIFNPDGSEAEKSGNGLRIFARYLWDEGLLAAFINPHSGSDSFPFPIQTSAGVVTAKILENGNQVSIEMGRATFESRSVAMTGPDREVINETILVEKKLLTYCAVSMGNPHCVVLYPGANSEIARTYGPQIENDRRFKKKTNVQFLQVMDPHNLKIEIWERGAGYTLASGSSSCAAAAVARRLDLCDSHVMVHNPGGPLEVWISENFDITLIGPVKKVFKGFLE